MEEFSFELKKYRIQGVLYTEEGNRAVNEDSVGWLGEEDKACFVLCDGLGGHGMGDDASQSVVDSILALSKKESLNRGFLKKAFHQAQDDLLELQQEKKAARKMKTTAVVLITDGKIIRIGHVGDSRLYLFRQGHIFFQTKDHSVPQMLVQAGEITANQIRNHPDRSMLMRVLGIPWEKETLEEAKALRIHAEDTFLLCSDGFWELIEEKEMENMLQESSSMKTWVEAMTKRIVENGKEKSRDNCSAIVGQFIKI